MKAIRAYTLLFFLATVLTSSLAAETGSSCSTVEDCPDLHSCEENVCVHKKLFPITFREVGGTIFILLMNAIMTAGGVGGGAAYVPYIMLIFQHTLRQSIFVAYACVFGGGMGNLVNIIRLRNVKTNRHLINFNVNMIILPALMIGVVIGVLLSRMFPPFVTNLVLLGVLGFSLYKNFFKLRVNLAKERNDRRIKKEQEKKEKERQVFHVHGKSTSEETRLFSQEKDENKTPSGEIPKIEGNVAHELVPFDKITTTGPAIATKENETVSKEEKSSTTDPRAAKLALLMQKEQRFPYHKVGELLINVVIIVVIGIIRGSKNFDPVVGVDWTCGWDFLWFGLGILAYLLNLTRSIYLVQKWQKEKLNVGYEFLPEEPLLDKRRIIKLVISSTAAGIIGAIVALGGAIIISPVLLDMHIPPAFSAATTGMFMVFSMFNAMFQTILDGRLSGVELAWFLPLAFAFSLISSKIVNWYVKKTGRQSTVIITVMLGAGLGFVCVLALFIKSLVENFQAQVKFKPIC